ncbi:MAG: DDE-type integrase/transposase/recombinase [Thermoanaerobaculia bacterium]|nr:DDE-type integrase/transposase/recombinase [Thermoanaerobaculia bacterium]
MPFLCTPAPACRSFPIQSLLRLFEILSLAIGTRIGELRLSPDRVQAATALEIELRARIRFLEASSALLRSRLQRALQKANTPYLPHERFQILKLRSEAGLSVSATAQFFLLCQSTISRWCAQARKDPSSESIGSLLTPVPPSTRYCDAFRAVVQFLAALNLRGAGQIAAFLCSAGLEVSRSTVRRILREPLSKPATTPPSGSQAPEKKHHVVTAREPLHAVMADITEFPAAFRQPSFKLAAFYDAFSRTPLVWGLFRKNPSGRDIAKLFNRLCRSFRKPRHLVTDQGRCFTSKTFKKSLKRKGTRQRFGAIGKHGSIALIERFWKTLKAALPPALLPPLTEDDAASKIETALAWYAFFRPHSALAGRTPIEVLHGLPRPSRGAVRPPRGQPGAPCPPLDVEIFTLDRDGHFPVIVRKAA